MVIDGTIEKINPADDIKTWVTVLGNPKLMVIIIQNESGDAFRFDRYKTGWQMSSPKGIKHFNFTGEGYGNLLTAIMKKMKSRSYICLVEDED